MLKPDFKNTLIKNFLSEDEIRKVIENVDPNLLKPAEVGTSAQTGQQKLDLRNSHLLWLPNNNEWSWLTTKIRDQVDAISPMLKLCGSHGGIQFTQYGPGQYYKQHADNYRHNQTYDRYMSMSILLESAERGGGLEVEGEGVIPLGSGDAFFFPSHLNHEALTVIEGTRKALVMWFELPRMRYTNHVVYRNYFTDEQCDYLMIQHTGNANQTDPFFQGRITWTNDINWRRDIVDKIMNIPNIIKYEFGEEEYWPTIPHLALWPEGHPGMKPHSDGGNGLLEHREYASFVYLSDFEGGETVFPDIPDFVKCDKGDLLVFNGLRMMHGISPITKGDRFTLPTWYAKKSVYPTIDDLPEKFTPNFLEFIT